MEERTQPSAATVDLSTAGSQGAINGAIFSQADPQPTGCGVIHDFLRIQSHNGSVEQGYNTDGAHQFDEKGGAFTHSIRLSDVPLININGVAYREFLLGVNQSQSAPLLSLDQLQIFLGSRGDLTGYDGASGTLAGLGPIYDMNAGGGGNWVELNAALTHGNGSGDMYLAIPNSFFVSTPDNPNPYVYLFSRFGDHFGANGGFEQWATPDLPAQPAPASLSGFVKNTQGLGLAGVTLTLTGTDSQGNGVTLTTTTAADGTFTFSTVPAGTYQVAVTPPPNYQSSSDQVGSVGGVLDGSVVNAGTLGSISLNGGDAGVSYGFFLRTVGG